eukprot:GCRY01004599.1.p1 GENE.GCRY01004599.1~~GCRY01004599.1.p1  ORF type:complete len:637 (+),score=156.09 GCRY01004599.1:164-2074(+)
MSRPLLKTSTLTENEIQDIRDIKLTFTPLFIKDLRSDCIVRSCIELHTLSSPLAIEDGTIVDVKDGKGGKAKMLILDLHEAEATIQELLPSGSDIVVWNPSLDKIDRIIVLSSDNLVIFDEEYRRYGPEECRLTGNRLFKDKKFSGALRSYKEGLRLDPNDPKLLGNAAECEIQLGEFHFALRHALLVLKGDADSQKNILRAARCHVALGQPLAARRLLSCYTARAEPLFLSTEKQIARALMESGTGEYSIEQMKREATANFKLEGHGNFTSPDLVFQQPLTKGGAYARVPIPKHTLLSVSKAIECLQLPRKLDQETVLTELIEQVKQNYESSLALQRDLSLFTRGSGKTCTFGRGEKHDRTMTLQKLDMSALDLLVCANCRVGYNMTVPAFLAPDYNFEDTLGLWTPYALFNHHCAPNTISYFVGDYMFISALKDIEANEELFINHNLMVSTFGAQVMTFGGLEMRCHCERCAPFRGKHGHNLIATEEQLYHLLQFREPTAEILMQVKALLRKLKAVDSVIAHSAYYFLGKHSPDKPETRLMWIEKSFDLLLSQEPLHSSILYYIHTIMLIEVQQNTSVTIILEAFPRTTAALIKLFDLVTSILKCTRRFVFELYRAWFTCNQLQPLHDIVNCIL